MNGRKALRSKLLVFLLAFAVVFTYSVMPMNQAYAASKKPAKVTVKSVKAMTASSVKVTWKKASNAKKYQIYVSTSKTKNFKRAATVSSSKRTYTVKKYSGKALKANKKYYFKVRAINGSKKGKFSTVKSVKTMKSASKIAPKIGESKTATMTTYIDMTKYAKGKTVKVWVPVPKSDDFQKITKVSFNAPGAKVAKITKESVNNNKMLYIEWDKNADPAARKASLKFTAMRYEVSRTNLKERSNVYTPAEVRKYISKESEYVKVKDPIVQEYALKATKGKTGTLAKARAIYEWTIAHLERIDNEETLVNSKGKKKKFSVEGCGYGDTVQILNDLKKFGRAGGHCTDINSTFVALCRASGIPAREMFGIRLNEDSTGGQHCWAEFYLPGTGWVYADPADVLKAIKPGTGTTVKKMKEARAGAVAKEKTEYYWGGVDNNRIVISRGRDITFNPKQSWGKCNTFGYPAAEVDGKRLKDFTDAKNFVYKIDCIDYSTIDKDGDLWKSLGIEYSGLDLANDYVIDARPADMYQAGHIVGSENIPVAAEYSAVDKEALKTAYENAAGKRIVIVCVKGRTLAGNAMQALKESGAYMPDVTYLIGGATAFAEGANKPYSLNLGIKEAEIADGDVLVDLRDDALYDEGHFKGSVRANVQKNGADGVKSDLDAAYSSVPEGKKLVLVCIKGHGLAKQAMAYYQKSGKDLKKITYLIGGATGVSEELKADTTKWE